MRTEKCLNTKDTTTHKTFNINFINIMLTITESNRIASKALLRQQRLQHEDINQHVVEMQASESCNNQYYVAH